MALARMAAIRKTNVQPIFEAWKKLDDPKRVVSERDLQDVFFLGNEEGTRALLKAADDSDAPLQPTFAGMDNPYDRAMWVILKRPAIWKFMQAFFPVDQLTNKRHWRR